MARSTGRRALGPRNCSKIVKCVHVEAEARRRKGDASRTSMASIRSVLCGGGAAFGPRFSLRLGVFRPLTTNRISSSRRPSPFKQLLHRARRHDLAVIGVGLVVLLDVVEAVEVVDHHAGPIPRMPFGERSPSQLMPLEPRAVAEMEAGHRIDQRAASACGPSGSNTPRAAAARRAAARSSRRPRTSPGSSSAPAASRSSSRERQRRLSCFTPAA